MLKMLTKKEKGWIKTGCWALVTGLVCALLTGFIVTDNETAVFYTTNDTVIFIGAFVRAIGSSQAGAWVQAIGVIAAIFIPIEITRRTTRQKEITLANTLLISSRQEFVLYKNSLAFIDEHMKAMLNKKGWLPPPSQSFLATNLLIYRPELPIDKAIQQQLYSLNTGIRLLDVTFNHHNSGLESPDEIVNKSFDNCQNAIQVCLLSIDALIKEIDQFLTKNSTPAVP